MVVVEKHVTCLLVIPTKLFKTYICLFPFQRQPSFATLSNKPWNPLETWSQHPTQENGKNPTVHFYLLNRRCFIFPVDFKGSLSLLEVFIALFSPGGGKRRWRSSSSRLHEALCLSFVSDHPKTIYLKANPCALGNTYGDGTRGHDELTQ